MKEKTKKILKLNLYRSTGGVHDEYCDKHLQTNSILENLFTKQFISAKFPAGS